MYNDIVDRFITKDDSPNEPKEPKLSTKVVDCCVPITKNKDAMTLLSIAQGIKVSSMLRNC